MSKVFFNDLSDRYGSMTIKELRQGLRRKTFVWPFLVIHLMAIVAVLFEFYLDESVPWSDEDALGVLNPLPFLSFSRPFWLMAGLVCFILIPFGGLNLMSQEMEDGNHELLQLTTLTRWQIIRGKFLTLWGLCLLIVVSLLPYLIVRYFIGGINVGMNFTALLSLVAFSAIFCSLVIGVSSFKTVGGRIGMMVLIGMSVLISGGIVLGGAGAVSRGFGVVYHMNALIVAPAVVVMGLSLARSRIRLVVSQYEAKPSGLVIGAFVFAPFIAGMSTAMTLAHAGSVGMALVGLVCLLSDISPKAPAWLPANSDNIPSKPGSWDSFEKR